MSEGTGSINDNQDVQVNKLDLLGAVIDANLDGDDEAAEQAFHGYLTAKTKEILSRDVEVPALSDDIPVDFDELDDIKIDDINIDDIIKSVGDE